jgi:pilus assembly protein Flp/PilA
MNAIKKFLRDEQGLTTVEYAIAGGLVGAAVIAAFIALGGEVNNVIEGITGELQTATP